MEENKLKELWNREDFKALDSKQQYKLERILTSFYLNTPIDEIIKLKTENNSYFFRSKGEQKFQELKKYLLSNVHYFDKSILEPYREQLNNYLSLDIDTLKLDNNRTIINNTFSKEDTEQTIINTNFDNNKAIQNFNITDNQKQNFLYILDNIETLKTIIENYQTPSQEVESFLMISNDILKLNSDIVKSTRYSKQTIVYLEYLANKYNYSFSNIINYAIDKVAKDFLNAGELARAKKDIEKK